MGEMVSVSGGESHFMVADIKGGRNTWIQNGEVSQEIWGTKFPIDISANRRIKIRYHTNAVQNVTSAIYY